MDREFTTPEEPGQAAKRMAPMIELVQDVYGGTTTMRAAGSKYLPRHPAEEPDDYSGRLKKPVLFNGLRRTLSGLVGLIFRKDVVLEDGDEAIAAHSKDLDERGRTLT